MNNQKYEELDREYNRLNNEGEGFSVGEEGEDINEIEDIGTLVHPAPSNDKIAVYETEDKYILVGDSFGPWAVAILKEAN